MPATLPLLSPRDADALAAVVREAAADGRAIVPQGGGTKLAWHGTSAALESAVGQPLSLLDLTDPVEHVPGDLTVTVPAGVTLQALNALLARQGQWLPLDPPTSDRATIGGIVATNDSGPRRHRYGAPRDLLIGIEMVLPDGRRAKSGGRVVKNVAGYDLGRLLCGSFGSLAVITAATFKLAPLPQASCTVVVDTTVPSAAGALAQSLAHSPLTPSAVEVAAPPCRLFVRFETTARAAEQQATAVVELCRRQAAKAQVLTGAAEEELWRQTPTSVWSHAGALAKVSVLPTDVPDVIDLVARERSLGYSIIGRMLAGVLYIRLPGEGVEPRATFMTRLREIVARSGGSAVLLEGDAALKRAVNPWGTAGTALKVMQAVKARLDPNGILPPLVVTA